MGQYQGVPESFIMMMMRRVASMLSLVVACSCILTCNTSSGSTSKKVTSGCNSPRVLATALIAQTVVLGVLSRAVLLSVGDERIALISNGLVTEIVLGEGTADVQPRPGHLLA